MVKRSTLTLAAAVGFSIAGLAGGAVQPAHAEPITDFSVFALGDVHLQRSTVLSGLVGAVNNIDYDIGAGALDGVRAGNNFNGTRSFTTSSGNTIVAGGNVTMDINSNLTGVDVIAGGTISIAATANPAASEQPNTVPVPFTGGSAFDLPTLPTATSFTAGGANVTVVGSQVLAPGTYGTVFMDNSETLSLSSGDYYFDAWDGHNTNTIFLDLTGGPINIFIVGSSDFDNDLVFDLTGGDASDVYVELHGNWLMNDRGIIYGTIFTPTGDINTGDDIESLNAANFTGALYAAGDIRFRNGSVVNHVLNDRFVEPPEVAVPEPSTIAAFATGLFAFGAVRRRRKAA